MNLDADLGRLASGGLADFPPSALSRLSEACRDEAERTGDSRFAFLAEPIAQVASDFEEFGSIRADAVAKLDGLFSDTLPVINSPATTAPHASRLARELAMSVAAALYR